MSFPGPRTRLAAVLGHPVDHSLSPAIHNAALRHTGTDAVYLAFDIEPPAFRAAVDGLVTLGAAGVNVTIPHKLSAFEIATVRSAEAERAGAANTLVFGEEGVTAHNTDVGGVRLALEHHGFGPRGWRCLLLGAGGAARAAGLALVEEGASAVIVCNRTPAKSRELAELLGADTAAWEDADRTAGSVDLIVNTTSVGMGGDASPLSAFALETAAASGCRGVLDLVYGPQDTPLVRRAKDAGLPAADGLSMLVYQAAESFSLFFGVRSAPVEVMMQAAARAAGRRRVPSSADAEAVPPLV